MKSAIWLSKSSSQEKVINNETANKEHILHILLIIDFFKENHRI